MLGHFAISKAGHDKGNIYIIIQEDTEYVYLADGCSKLIDSPKKKKRKHIQIINKMIEKKPVKNEELKRAIKLYKAAK